MTESAGGRGRPSLRVRLLAFLMVPILALLLCSAAITYGVVVNYDKAEHDRALVTDARSVAALMRTLHPSNGLSAEARYLLAFDTEVTNYFVVQSSQHGILSSTDHYPTPPRLPATDASPLLFDGHVNRNPVRGVCLRFQSTDGSGDIITVTMAETLDSRKRLAREIMLITLPMQGLLIAGILTLVWVGVSLGLRSLEPLMRKLASREHGLNVITDASVPQEILPLTRTLDALFGRLREAIDVQEHFIADAAHQLRTPLAGLRLHVERALDANNPATTQDALAHMAQLTSRAGRTSKQLLSLMRAQSPLDVEEALTGVDLASLVRDAVTRRVHDGLRAGMDLGYQGPDTPVIVECSAAGVNDLLDNLIDNALAYAGRGSTVTVSLQPAADGTVTLAVEDNGPGVPPAYLARLGERFFRVPDGREGGTGLGLAIVRRIADRHHATVEIANGAQGGLRVSIRFPKAGGSA